MFTTLTLGVLEDRVKLKSRANLKEYNMRDAFRHVILQYDWGMMNQSIFAALINWEGWLTTNYTRFADRGIDLAGAFDRNHSKDYQKSLAFSEVDWDKPKPWRIVGTAIEAALLRRETLHGSRDKSDRYLFKLHGDIGHLHTMAIAGHDKELTGPLSFEVDSLYEVYSAAEEYLRKMEPTKEENDITWHIVGHGLGDELLLQLITNVSSNLKFKQLRFVVVSVKEPPTAQLYNHLKHLKNQSGLAIYGLTIKAAECLARIFNQGLPGENMAAWLEKMDVNFFLYEPNP